MSQNMIDDIRRTEARAEELKAQAQAQARDRVRAAEEEMLAWKEEEVKKLRQQARETLEAAEAASRERIASEKDTDQTEGDALRRKAAGRIDAAAELVVERIVAQYGG